MEINTNNVKVTLDYNVALNSMTYAKLYLEQRIMECKTAGRDYINYQRDLDTINKAYPQST